MPLTTPAGRQARRRDRGAALLVVIVSTAILTAIAVDLAYNTRVSLLTAANSRDELRAEYLARGGVQLSRLVLQFQKQLDDAVPAGGAVPRVQVWNLVPVTSAFTDGLFGGGDRAGGAPATFEAKIEDEGSKVNAQLDALAQGGLLGAQVESLLELIGDPRWDALFDREDANGLKVTRPDLAVYLHDWTDADSTGSAISANLDRPFADGFGDENQPYARGDDRYEVKNARFDSLDELYLVAGIDDAFMAAFGSHLTVYPHMDGRINVNTLDPAELLRNARVMAEPSQQPRLADPAFPRDLLKAVSEARLGGLLTMRPVQFAQLVQSFGVQVDGMYLQEGSADKSGAFTDRSLVYRIRATGSAGAAERRVDATLTFDPRQLGQEPATAGRLLHWREE
jgi:general secretion pathway protein K